MILNLIYYYVQKIMIMIFLSVEISYFVDFYISFYIIKYRYFLGIKINMIEFSFFIF